MNCIICGKKIDSNKYICNAEGGLIMCLGMAQGVREHGGVFEMNDVDKIERCDEYLDEQSSIDFKKHKGFFDDVGIKLTDEIESLKMRLCKRECEMNELQHKIDKLEVENNNLKNALKAVANVL